MPTISTDDLWSTISSNLNAELILKSDEYFNGYGLLANDNPLASIDPKYHDKFYGPNICNIFIASRLYGWSLIVDTWTFNWPPTGLVESLERIRSAYNQWSKFKVFMYGDLLIAERLKLIDFDAGNELEERLMTTFNELENLCLDNSDIGFNWVGTITSEPDYTFFLPIINEHYNAP